jgi:tight adherence protein B
MMQNLIIIITLVLTVLLAFISVSALTGFSAGFIQERINLYRNRFTENARLELADQFVTVDPGKLFILNSIALIVIPLLVHNLFQLWIITGSVAAVLLIVPGLIWKNIRDKRMRKIEEQLPDAFLLIASSLQSGASFNTALEDMVKQTPAPLSQEFSLMTKRVRLGVPMEDCLLEMEKRIPLQSFVMASSAVRISREVGGNLVKTISSMARTLRRKQTMEGKIDSLTSQGRAQGRFMSALPVVLAIGLSFLEPEAMKQLYTTRMGILILAVMVTMQVMGFVFIRKITTIDS